MFSSFGQWINRQRIFLYSWAYLLSLYKQATYQTQKHTERVHVAGYELGRVTAQPLCKGLWGQGLAA
ncbi:hypothetical protein AC626_18830 [Pseudoalteromonas rubra]|uniref:Uncharacterized protein n=1 Tax=Pseudoalteromonas rubra TaxID=43658 RepID=A0A0L0EP47_9GAMM|nr:hypothetical protein AC626_18830 [Pseudoalteromonas rubra]